MGGAGLSSSRQTCRHWDKPDQGVRGPEDSKMPSWLSTDPCRDLRGKQGQIAREELKEIAGLCGDKREREREGE